MKRLLRPVLFRYLLFFVLAAGTLKGLAQSTVTDRPSPVPRTLPTALHTPPSVPHTLLWRISGKGLQKPSYLYGTMHLNDKRLFLFGDSLYHAIESTDGLAIEVNPDEMAAYFVNRMFDQIENGKKLNELVDRQYFDRHRKELAKKFKKPAEEISASDVFKEKNKWMTEYIKKGDMPTFMDAYLYNIARRQGKWLGGIEDIGDQTGLMPDLVDQSDIDYLLEEDGSEGSSKASSMLEKMIDAYGAGDLERIESIFNGRQTGTEKDRVMIRRNMKMTRRIDSLVNLRTMIFAVGCAHLPGDSGIIDLLEKKGFTVDPVFSSKKIAADNYTFQEVHLPWVDVTDKQGSYNVQMPANPATVNLYGIIEMKFLLDLFNMSGFCTMAVINPVRTGEAKDSLFNNTAKRMFRMEGVPQGKKLDKNGVAGKEFIHYDDAENMRVQMFSDNKMVYLAMVSSVKKDMLISNEAEKFFQSFTINDLGQEAPAVASTFTDSIMGVSFVSPAALTYNEKLSSMKNTGWKVTSFTGTDRSTGSMVMLMSKEIRPGYHITSERETYDEMDAAFKKQYDHLEKDSILLDSVKMMRYTGENILRPGLFISATVGIKDSRQIILMVISDSADRNSPALKEVFHSFHFISHPAVHWQEYESPDHVFGFYGPSPARTHFYEEGNSGQWASYDTTTATSYMVIPDTLDKYTWYASDSLLWKSILYRDTLGQQVLEIKDVVNGGIAGKEYLVRRYGNTSYCVRIRQLVAGDKVYKLFAPGHRQLLYSPEVNRFFETFRLHHIEDPGSATRSKAALLIHDLGSDDSATAVKAYRALRSAPFQKADAPLLRDALFRLYKLPDDTSFRIHVNTAIASALATLHDPASVAFVRDAYPSLANEKQMLRNTALSVLAGQHDSYSYAALAELLKQGPTKERLGYVEVNDLKDSLSLTSGLLPSLRAWMKDTLQAPAIASIVLPLVDSGYVPKDSLRSYGDAFIASAAALLPGLRANEDYADYYLYSLLKLVGRLHTPAAFSLLKDYQGVKNKYLLHQTVKQLLEGGQIVSAAALRRLAADPEYRIALYDDVKQHHKTALFPKDYLTQSSFAMAVIHAAADDEDEGAPAGVTFLSKRTTSYHGRSYTFYLYKVCYSSDDGSSCYLGVAGGFDPTGAGLKPKKDLSYVYRKEPFDEKHVGMLFKNYFKWLDEED